MWHRAFPSRRPAAVHIKSSLAEACRLVSQRLSRPGWHLAYHSRSGRPNHHPRGWSLTRDFHRAGRPQRGNLRDVVVAPIGSICEHIEVVYDLDVELGQLCEELGINLVRAEVVGSHPRFVRMIRELVLERTEPGHCGRPWGRTARHRTAVRRNSGDVPEMIA